MELAENVLRELDDEAYFVERVGAHFRNTDDYGGLLSCTVTVDDERLRWAHKEYQQGVQEFSIRLASGDPDHYKRSGVLLRALYRIRPITNVEFDPELDEFDSLFTPIGVSNADAEYALSLGRTFKLYHNELTAFSYAYNVCAMYEDAPVEVSAAYLHTMCVYLASSDNLSAESLYMIFKSLMLA
jgi:hypothetical protein